MSQGKAYQQSGYSLTPKVFGDDELRPVRSLLDKFHASWISDNQTFYQSRAINSAYLTSPEYLSTDERVTLFNFITHSKILAAVSDIIPDGAAFMNTQLFFNPVNSEQKNYWHRDMQYGDQPFSVQKAMLKEVNALHVRIPLDPELGIELIPGTHFRWDTDKELAVRLEQDEHKNYDDLNGSVALPMEAGDMLVFSAQMIHRGLYGMNRFALDILYCDATPDLLQFAKHECFPTEAEMERISNTAPFERALAVMNQSVEN